MQGIPSTTKFLLHGDHTIPGRIFNRACGAVVNYHRSAIRHTELIAVTRIYVGPASRMILICVKFSVGIKTISINPAVSTRIGSITKSLGEVPITTRGHRDHPTHGAVLLEIIPSVPSLIMSNVGTVFIVEVGVSAQTVYTS